VVDCPAVTSDAYIYSATNAVYATARASSAGFNDAQTVMFLSHQANPNYIMNRVFVGFDTSAVPAGATVTRAYLKLAFGEINTTVRAFDLVVLDYDWPTITAGNRETIWDAVLSAPVDAVWGNTNGKTTGQLYDGADLDTAWVKKGAGAVTKYAIVVDHDLSATQPASVGINRVQIWSANSGGALMPVLVVEYTEGGTLYEATVEIGRAASVACVGGVGAGDSVAFGAKLDAGSGVGGASAGAQVAALRLVGADLGGLAGAGGSVALAVRLLAQAMAGAGVDAGLHLSTTFGIAVTSARIESAELVLGRSLGAVVAALSRSGGAISNAMMRGIESAARAAGAGEIELVLVESATLGTLLAVVTPSSRTASAGGAGREPGVGACRRVWVVDADGRVYPVGEESAR
jgi:hypothetical protein